MPVLTDTRSASGTDSSFFSSFFSSGVTDVSQQGRSAYRTWFPQIAEAILIEQPVNAQSDQVDLFDTMKSGLPVFLSSKLGIDGVKAILIAPEGAEIHVWTIIEERDREIRSRIHIAEFDVFGALGGLHLNFSVISSRGQPVSSLVPNTAVLIWGPNARSSDARRSGGT